MAQIKYNLFLLFFWLFVFGIINSYIGSGFGLPYLFLSPEYLGNTNVVAFLLLGSSIGGFIMAFHIYSYIQLGPKFPFIATLARPFNKFMINNSLIPTLFVINLSINVFKFQKAQEYLDIEAIYLNVGGLIFGVYFFILLTSLYFLPTNKDLYKITGKKSEDFVNNNISNIHATLHRNEPWYKSFLTNRKDRYYYFTNWIKINRSRSSAHYDINILNKVFNQNHINASVFEVLLLASIFTIGFFKDVHLLQVPASVSVMMILTLVVMLVSAFFSWFKYWTYPLILISFMLINYISINTNYLQFKSYAFGLCYDDDVFVDYNTSAINSMRYSDSIIDEDYINYVNTLNNWKENTGKTKPKLVILNTSGGGLRSALWTFNVLQELDSLTNKEFSKNVQMITGASGGMIGAAFYRDLILKENEGVIDNRLEDIHLQSMSQDLLNRISFAFSTGDLFFRFQNVVINDHKYPKDRGYAFEQGLISNLNGAFDKTLGYYKEAEQSGAIPTMIFTPTIINDGRVLLVSSQYHGYLQSSYNLDNKVGLNPQIENIEFLRFFQGNHPEEIRYTSVLRMSSTFPYIMPMVTLPTKPSINVMDAGIRDNYGSKLTVRYILTLRKWIKENTSGVIVLKIRDKDKNLSKGKEDSYKNSGLVERLFLPFGNMYGNFPRVQDFNQDEMFSALIRSIDYPLDIISLNLTEKSTDKVSLSWHLTAREKEFIKQAFSSENNQKAKDRLLSLLNLRKENNE